MTTRNHTDHTDGPITEPAPTRPARLLAVLSVPAAIASFLYVACGVGFYRAPWGYTIAWLTLIASLAYGLPMLDVTIDTVAGACNRVKRGILRAKRALAGVLRHKSSATMRQVRVVRGTAKAKP
ncbi:hypothetical protein [uncultured Bifidobacterium sp.]|uniref:hypothetical protein n=1 Tax=uncultured Bifidobacterium sp. TaxID=165187 RepID=UPI002591F518|nr:hypothetical protein [uncultured Bifidobacterium sp.]